MGAVGIYYFTQLNLREPRSQGESSRYTTELRTSELQHCEIIVSGFERNESSNYFLKVKTN